MASIMPSKEGRRLTFHRSERRVFFEGSAALALQVALYIRFWVILTPL
jgi:hypothetical protein